VNTSELTPDLSALLNAAGGLPSDIVRMLRDFADFLGVRYAPLQEKEPQEEWHEAAAGEEPADDDDSVDLGAVSPDEDVLNLSGILDGDAKTGIDLTRVYHLDNGMHSAIGIV
jgi:hypothetical protein